MAVSSTPQPSIPEKFIDVPSQRLYYLSFGLVCQAIKILDFFRYLLSSEDTALGYARKWLFVDFAYCAVLWRLRIPRLNYTSAVVILQIASLWFIDGLLFGGISLTFGGGRSSAVRAPYLDVPSTPQPFHLTDLLPALGLGFLSSDSGSRESNLVGQHTVRMSPISTAQLNPSFQTYCLSPSRNTALIPILLNNTNLVNIRYSLTPLGYPHEESERASSKLSKVERFELNPRELKAIEQARLEVLQLNRPTASTARNPDDFDEYDDDEDNDKMHNPHNNLQKSQNLVHIRVSKPGIIRLDRVLDRSGIQSRLVSPIDVKVVPCPEAAFAEETAETKQETVRCAGENTSVGLQIDLHGVPPLSLRWAKVINGKTEHFLVEGINGDYKIDDSPRIPLETPQKIKVPLAVTLDTLGTHVYALEEVIDGLGNNVPIRSDSPSTESMKNGNAVETKSTRSFMLLRRPKVSFKHCGPGSPASLLVGSETKLAISAYEADGFEAPWDITVKYQPITDDDGKGASRKHRPWTRTITTRGEKKELNLRANAPGEYTLVAIQGKYCTGDVLAPETCRVVEKPKPTAEIEWKRIHECSGDTGVSASLVLHGTPPFQVYYRTQRDNEAPRELSKTFTTSRGELTLQPERSGHYIYTFVQISDANYKKVELDGPSIDQVVHPLATADFAGAGTGARSKKMINSCSGNLVEVDIELRGTGPWNMEVQLVGPHSSEIVPIRNIENAQKRIQLPIPRDIDRDGGSFEIDLVSIEDAYGCKRPLSVPGISVNVRRVQPTVRFYGEADKRHVTTLERQHSSLPLRLTGDGPWRVKYRRSEDQEKIYTKTISHPNDPLVVDEKGTFELMKISDSQCPGTVIEDGRTFTVDWVPRPIARLSTQIKAEYEPRNGSHILPSVCLGGNDFVDLDLEGRPPFQIVYNVAQNSDTGGTKILDQPTFNSIQPRTRFQLHSSSSGRMYYEVKQIGDASYPLTKQSGAVIPRSERLLFEQEVSQRPSARFRNNNRLSYCLRDALTPQNSFMTDGVVILEGTPPFDLEISIKNLAASHTDTVHIQSNEYVWKLDLPSYQFQSIGPHLITIESVKDTSHCAQADAEPLGRSIWVDVADTGAIIPFDRRDNYCVGDISQFQLEGIPPWTIGYRINGKSYTQEAKVSPFSLLQQQPGEFAITSIAHGQKMCKSTVNDLKFVVHPLPSAYIGKGSSVFQHIHEGDQAEIVFTLVGEPPFTITYQRSEPTTKKGKLGKVLETHTVSGVTTKEYSIYSALEGTWTVTSVSDKYCRYPPAQADGTLD